MDKIILLDISKISLMQYRRMYKIVDIDRKKRADNYKNLKDKKMCVASEICLYYLLTSQKYSNKLTEKSYNKFNKPFLKNMPKISYSIAHSKDICIAAITNHGQVGVDVEDVFAVNDLQAEKLLKRYFASEDLIEVSEKLNYIDKFIKLWTQKEAAYKAKGEGTLLKALKTPFSDDDVVKLKTINWGNYVISIYSYYEIKNFKMFNSLEIDYIIDKVERWKLG